MLFDVRRDELEVEHATPPNALIRSPSRDDAKNDHAGGRGTDDGLLRPGAERF
jgi:hypothetical protein